jgi:dipeptidyl aminopeptidase/acylaminoacyl peptidase
MGANAVEAVDSIASSRPGETNQIVSAAQQPPQARSRQPGRTQGVYKDRITPHWFAENTCFWYRNNLSGDTKEFVLVNAEQGTRRPAFDHPRLATAISEAADASYQGDKLPFDDITLSDDAKSVRFTVDQTAWLCVLDSYKCSQTDARESAPSTDEAEPATRFGRRRGPNQDREPSADSPDGAWTALVKDNNVFIHSRSDDQDVQLSTDGEEGAAYGEISWAPDSKTLVAFRIEPGDNKEVYRIESSPEGGGRAKLHSGPYALPGDKFATYELYLFDISTRKGTKPDVDKMEMEWGRPRLRWKKDQRRFMYEKIDRGHQRFRVIEVDSHTGQTRNLIDEKTETFIWTAHTENLGLDRVNWLEKTDEIVYVSEQDGWRHLYLVNAEEGKTTNPITQGPWVVRGIDLIDEDARQIWFSACGKNPDQDPYLIHYYRVNFDGSGLTALTEGNGNHAIQYSPDRRYLIDTYSRVDMAPVHELRRVSDGAPVCKLDEADVAELKADGWTPPEVFVAKGRDGETDVWGIICRPLDLDPAKKYPVIEQIYAGPQSAYVPKRFSPRRSFKTKSISRLTCLAFRSS